MKLCKPVQPAFDYYDVVASVCRESFFDFVKEFWDEVVPEPIVLNWHIEYLCNELQAISERVFARKEKEYDLVINISPGTSKSSICSIFLPAWIWTCMPSAGIIGGSYADNLAMDLSRKNRDVVMSEKYQKCFSTRYSLKNKKLVPWVVLSEDQNTKSYFATTKKGARMSVGVGGSITGKHGDFIIVDDPLNPNQAISETELRTANRWMSETLPTRKRNKSVTPIILIMQRLHQDDPTTKMIEKAEQLLADTGEYPLKHICLPAEESPLIKPKGLRKYYTNGLMDEVRLSKKILAENRTALGEYAYAGQFSQHPVPLGGGMFKTERISVELPPAKFASKIRFWDKAGTKDGGAYTVGVLLGLDLSKRFWILDVVRGQWSSEKRERIIKETANMDGREVKIGLEQEPGSGGKESAENTVKNLPGHKVITDRPSGDKTTRADPYSVQVNNGNVFMKPGLWNKAYIDELEFFPYSKYKDQTDASSGAFNILNKKVTVVGGWKKRY